MKKQYRHILEYAGLRLFCFTVKLLPVFVSIKVGRKTGMLALSFLKKRVDLARSNLQLAYGESLSLEERDRIISSLFCFLGEALIESIVFKKKEVETNITVEGMQYMKSALDKNRGVIMIGPHFGQWELAGFVFGSQIKNASTVYKSLKNPYVDNYLFKVRQESGLNLIPNKNALRPVLSNLKKGSLVGMLFDQNAGRNGLAATFFGKTAYTYSAPAYFALKTGCPVVPVYVIKDSGFRKHRLIIKEPFPLIDTGNEEADIMANVQQYNDFIEDVVRRYPDQWFGWLHRRWKIPRKYANQ